jgi:hypothetical protein
MKERSPFAAWPAEIRSAVMVDDYAVLTYREQWLLDVKNELERLEENYIKIINNYYELGGTIEHILDDTGKEIPSEILFSLGSTKIQVSFGSDMMPVAAIHYMDLLAKPVVSSSEAGAISEMIRAVIYRDAPDKGAMNAAMAQVEIRNAEMVNGIDDLTRRMKSDTVLLNNAFTGARIERVANDE